MTSERQQMPLHKEFNPGLLDTRSVEKAGQLYVPHSPTAENFGESGMVCYTTISKQVEEYPMNNQNINY
jgi:hypothetical protein